MMRSLFIAMLMLFTLAAAACTTDAKAGFGEWVEVPYGGDVTFKNGPQIKFLEVEDSRCAIGVTCIWAGEAKAKISFKEANSTTTHTLTQGGGSSEGKDTIRGYEILFTVNPYPKAGQAVPKKDYTLKLMLNKTGGNATPVPAGTSYPVTRVKAPIDALDIAVAKSLPPQYTAQITSGLPSGCAKFDGYDVKRDGELITITVWNTMPSDPQIACTMIYGYVNTSVELGSDFTTGKMYTVMVNDVTKTFVAQ